MANVLSPSTIQTCQRQIIITYNWIVMLRKCFHRRFHLLRSPQCNNSKITHPKWIRTKLPQCNNSLCKIQTITGNRIRKSKTIVSTTSIVTIIIWRMEIITNLIIRIIRTPVRMFKYPATLRTLHRILYMTNTTIRT